MFSNKQFVAEAFLPAINGVDQKQNKRKLANLNKIATLTEEINEK